MARNTLPSRVFDDLIKRINVVLGSKFQDFYAGADPQVFRNEWMAALADFKPVELDRGIAQMQKQKFVPTLGEFSQWCRPALDPEYAFYEAAVCLAQRDKGERGDWSHPAVWRAAQSMGMEVREGNYAKVRTRWKIALDREFANGWSDIPDPPLKLGNDGAKLRGPNETERAKIRELLGDRQRTGCRPGGPCERAAVGDRPCHAGHCAKGAGEWQP